MTNKRRPKTRAEAAGLQAKIIRRIRRRGMRLLDRLGEGLRLVGVGGVIAGCFADVPVYAFIRLGVPYFALGLAFDK